MAFRISIPAVTFFTRKVLEASALNVGLLTSSFFAARAIFSVVAGELADKYGGKVSYAAFLCFLVNGFVVQLYSIAKSVILIIVVRFLQGVLNGISWVSVQFILGRSVSEEFRGRAYAIYFASGSLGIVAGNMTYSILSHNPIGDVLNISTVLFIVSSILALAITYNSRFETMVSSVERGREKSGKYEGKLISIIPLVIVVFNVTFFASMMRGDLIYVYINEFFGVSEAVVAQTIAFSSLIALAGGYMLSWFSDRFSDFSALRASLLIAYLGGFLVSVRMFPLAILGLAIFYAANSGIVPISRKIAVTYYRLGGTALGLVNALGNVGAVIGASVLGYLYDKFDGTALAMPTFELSVFTLISTLSLALSLIASLFLRENYKVAN